MEPLRNPNMTIAAIRTACAAHPDQRVMQIIVNALGNDPFYVEDEAAAAALVRYARGT